MSVKAESYCRLCADSRLVTEMLSLDNDPLDNSKVIMKLSWINIDISTSNGLPNTVCYPCLNILDSTWSFLNNVRSAQEKLLTLLLDSPTDYADESELNNQDSDHKIFGKPINKDWENFKSLKSEHEIDNSNDNIPNLFAKDMDADLKETTMEIKHEGSDQDYSDSITVSAPLKSDIEKKHSSYSLEESIDSETDDAVVNLNENHMDVKLELNSDEDINKGMEIKIALTKTKENKILNITWDNIACKCATCDEEFSTILQLQLHSLNIHTFCCVFKCTECPKVTPHYISFVKHARTHYKVLKRCCEFCNITFTYLSDLTSHKMEQHKTVFKTKCSNCGINFKTAEKLDKHLNWYNKSAKDRMEHKCTECGKVFMSRWNLLNHVKIHKERSKDFVCQMCGRSFYDKVTLRAHLVVHDKSRTLFKCNHCPVVCRTKSNLLTHQSLHTGVRPYVCEECGKSFRTKSNLVSHSTVHASVRYNCEKCNYSFKSMYILKRHLKLNTCVSRNKNGKTRGKKGMKIK